MATTGPQIIDQLLADRRAYRWPRPPKFNLRRHSAHAFDFVNLVGDALPLSAGRFQSPRLFCSTSQVALAVLSFLHKSSSGARLSSAMVMT
jgi:hypothetical protein